MGWVVRYQTLIVGGLGFAGVIIALVVNDWYARAQRREERRHERQTVRVALLVELRINRESLAEDAARATDDYVAMRTYAMDDAYRAFTDRIGLLSSEEVYKVMDAYLSLQHFHGSLVGLGVPLGTGIRLVRVSGENTRMVLGLTGRIIGLIGEAIAILERARDAA